MKAIEKKSLYISKLLYAEGYMKEEISLLLSQNN